MRMFTLSLVLAVASIAGGRVHACGPEDAFARGTGFGGAGKFAGNRGGGFPVAGSNRGGFPVAYNPAAYNQSAMLAMAQLNQHRQLLAMQAAARRARLKPIRQARAIAMREQKLAARADRRAWVLAKQEERKRKEAEAADPQPSARGAGEVLVASYASSLSR